MIHETSVIFNYFIWLIAQEDFINLGRRERFSAYENQAFITSFIGNAPYQFWNFSVPRVPSTRTACYSRGEYFASWTAKTFAEIFL
jgi:hypothetical protein